MPFEVMTGGAVPWAFARRTRKAYANLGEQVPCFEPGEEAAQMAPLPDAWGRKGSTRETVEVPWGAAGRFCGPEWVWRPIEGVVIAVTRQRRIRMIAFRWQFPPRRGEVYSAASPGQARVLVPRIREVPGPRTIRL